MPPPEMPLIARFQRNTLQIFLMTLMFFSTTPSFADEISSVTVRTQNFEVVKVVNDKESLQQFEKLWQSKTKLKSTTPKKWIFKIDIKSKGHSVRQHQGSGAASVCTNY